MDLAELSSVCGNQADRSDCSSNACNDWNVGGMFHEKVWKNVGKGICILYSDDCALFICISLALTGVSQLTMKNNAKWKSDRQKWRANQ